MSKRHLPTIAFLVVSAMLLGDLAMRWPRLPERVASHFDAAGLPNGWMSRQHLLVVMLVLVFVLGFAFVSAGRIATIPDRSINLPNKDYWLAPERRADTMAAIAEGLRWFLVLVWGFLAALSIAALEANLSPAPRLALSVWAVLPIPLIAAAGLILWISRRFRRPAAGRR